MRYFVLLVLLAFSLSCVAQELQVLRTISVKARKMTADHLGNIYLVREDNSLLRLDAQGDSSAFYRSVQNGNIGSLDATNPMRVVIYYPDYRKVILLDRQLALKNELDLRKMNIAGPSVVAASADGNLWIYDQFNARLRKIDEQLNEVVESNDLRMEIQTVPSPTFMVERDWRVYLCDTAKGIFTFDRYGNYVNTLSIFDVNRLQVFGSQLVYRHGDSLLSWDLSKVRAQSLKIPGVSQNILDAVMTRDKLIVLYPDRLVLYRLES